jgi:hypothetical protein
VKIERETHTQSRDIQSEKKKDQRQQKTEPDANRQTDLIRTTKE